jgi:hypothetical protein
MRTSRLALVTVLVAMTPAACGDGGTQPQLPPAGVPVKWSSISVGSGNFFAFACGLTVEGRAYCWGDNATGQLGTGTREESLRPVPVSGTLQFASLSIGWKSACALTTSGDAWCWGELVPNGQSIAAPTRVPGGLSFRQLSHDRTRNVCALTAEGESWCWSIFDLQPVRVPGGQRFAMLTTGSTMLVPGEGYERQGACGVTFSGEVYCWGWADVQGPTLRIVAPIKISGAPEFVSLTIGGTDCGVTRDGAVYCHEGLASGWRLVPFAPAFVSAAQGHSEVDLIGPAHVCALTAPGIAHCWGGNSLGQLGTGDLKARSTPTPVAGGHVFSTLAVGGENSCGVTVTGDAYCWGVNREGQLGNGTKSSTGATPEQLGVRVPTRVLDPLR